MSEDITINPSQNEVEALRFTLSATIKSMNVLSANLHNLANELSEALTDPIKFQEAVKRQQQSR